LGIFRTIWQPRLPRLASQFFIHRDSWGADSGNLAYWLYTR